MRKILLFALACCAVSGVHAQIYVSPSASGAQNGTSWTDAYTDLQMAIYQASAGDTLWVASGSYYPSIDTLGALPSQPERRSFWLKNGVVVYGGFNGTETSLSQRNPFGFNKPILDGELSTGIFAEHVINVYSSIDTTAIMDGFNVENGKSFVASTEKNGSGMILRGDAGFYNMTFRNNETYNQGGAIYAEYSASKFVACSFANNSTVQYDGGAVNLVYSNIKMYNCVFFDNHATRYGGAITTVESNLLVQNGTFVGNTGGSNVFQFSTSGTIDLNNCIFTADNIATDVLGTSGGMANFRECLMPMDNNWLMLCPTCWGGTPTFVNGPAGDFGLVAGSDGIDDTLAVAPVNDYADIAGNPRLVGFSMDLGAYEFQGGVGVDPAMDMQQLTAYPSPTTSSLSIEVSSLIQNVAIYNVAGQLVQTENSSTFSVAQLPAGLYFLHVTTADGAGMARFIKE